MMRSLSKEEVPILGNKYIYLFQKEPEFNFFMTKFHFFNIIFIIEVIQQQEDDRKLIYTSMDLFPFN